MLTHWGHREDVASEIGAQLSEIGRVRRQPRSLVRRAHRRDREPAHAYIWAWVESPDPGSGFLQPLLTWGTWLYRDEQLEGLLRRAASLHDQDERLRAFREFERLWIGEHAAVVPLAYSDRCCGGAPGSPGCGRTRPASARSTTLLSGRLMDFTYTTA